MAVVIIGAGGFGREIVQVLDSALGGPEETSEALLGFLDDGTPDLGRLERLGIPLLGRTSALADLDAQFLIGVGSPAVRRQIHVRARVVGAVAAPPVVHQSAAVGRDVRIGDGSVISAQSVITTNIEIGMHLHLNLGSTVGHDCRIGDFVTVAPGVNISGNVTIGDAVEFGTGSKVLPGVSIGEGAVIGAGAVVTKDVASSMTVVGVPARPLQR